MTTTAETDIHVSGRSEIYRRPERCVLRFTISGEGKDSKNVSVEIVKKSNQQTAALKEWLVKDNQGLVLESSPITHFQSKGISTSSWTNYDDKGNDKGKVYSVSNSFEVKFQAFDVLSDYLTTLSESKLVSIDELSWRLTDKTRASLFDTVRTQAVFDATEKAKTYAKALGGSGVLCKEIRDNSHYSHGNPGLMKAAFRGRAAGNQDDESLQFTPSDVSISADIQCKFIVQWAQ